MVGRRSLRRLAGAGPNHRRQARAPIGERLDSTRMVMVHHVDGSSAFMHEIDAHEAIKRHRQEWSLTRWPE